MTMWRAINTAPTDTIVRIRPARSGSGIPYEFAHHRPARDPQWRAATDNRVLSPREWAPIETVGEVEILRTALEWYAEPVLAYAITQASEPRSAVHQDGGRRAREALARAEAAQ